MRRVSVSLSLACLLSVAVSATAYADAQSVVLDGTSRQPIRSERFGTCIQTKWSAANDPCGTPQAAPAAAAPAPVPAAAPIARAVAPQPVNRLQREALTIYFDFNKSLVTAASAAKLDAIAHAVNQSPRVTRVKIVGYTDTIGSDSYNEKLSVARAKAVKTYLDTKVHVPVGVAAVRGLGAKDPVVSCTNVQNHKKKIACLARDRRVEVEFDFEQ